MTCILTRRETFSACHRLHSSELSDEENLNIFGKCNNPNGHGHNYVVEASVKGTVDKKTGMVMNLADLKVAMKRVLDQLDHKNLDKDVPGLRGVVTTTENIAIFFFNELKPIVPLLFEVKIHETENNVVIYREEDNKQHVVGAN